MIEQRLEAARTELRAETEFDITLVNTSVRDVCTQLVALMTAKPAISRQQASSPVRRAPIRHARHGFQSGRQTVAGTPALEGIINPPIDELLDVVDSKYGLVIMASKRARQINAYYAQLGEGLLEYVGPAGRDPGAGEAAVDRAARDQRGHAARRGHGNPARLSLQRQAPMRIVLGVGAGIAAYKVCELLRLLTESGHAGPGRSYARFAAFRRCGHLGGPVRASRSARAHGTTSTRCRTCGSVSRPTWCSSPRRPLTCWPGPRPAWLPTCSPTCC